MAREDLEGALNAACCCIMDWEHDAQATLLALGEEQEQEEVVVVVEEEEKEQIFD